MTLFFFPLKDGIVSNISYKIAAVQQFESVLFKMKQPEQMVVAKPNVKRSSIIKISLL